MNKTRKVQLIAAGIIVALLIAWFGYGAYQKRQATRAVIAMVTETSAGLAEVLQSRDPDPASPDAPAAQARLDEALKAAEARFARLRGMDGSRIRPLADAANDYLNTCVEILRRKVRSGGHRLQLALSMQALREHMSTDNRSGPWVTEAIRRKESMDRDFRDYRRATDALAQLLGDYPASRRRMAGFVDSGLLLPDEAAESARSEALASITTTGEEVEKSGRLEAYR